MTTKRPSLYDTQLDEELMQAIGQDDRAAFTVLYDRYWRRLFTVAYNYTRSHETAQEVVQEVFLSIWLKRSTLLLTGKVEAYLMRAVKYRIYDQFDKQRSIDQYADYAAQHLAQAEETTEQQIVFQETTSLIEQELNGLPETTRRIFVLSRFEGLPVAQVAELVKLSPKAVEYHLTKALRLLRTRLSQAMLIALAWLIGS